MDTRAVRISIQNSAQRRTFKQGSFEKILTPSSCRTRKREASSTDKPKEPSKRARALNSWPTEYRGGIGDKGWKALVDFVNQGGTLISLGSASDLLIDKLPLPVTDLKKTLNREQHYAPGTILNLQVDTQNPIGFGMAPDTYGFYINSPFFQLREGFSSQKVSVVARFPNDEVNASGWLRGEDYMKGPGSRRLHRGKPWETGAVRNPPTAPRANSCHVTAAVQFAVLVGRVGAGRFGCRRNVKGAKGKKWKRPKF